MPPPERHLLRLDHAKAVAPDPETGRCPVVRRQPDPAHAELRAHLRHVTFTPTGANMSCQLVYKEMPAPSTTARRDER